LNTNALIDALGGVNDSYIISAWERLAPEEARPARAQTARRPAVRRALIGIAAALAILIASFSAAMALSADLRSAVLSIFRVPGVETVPEDSGVLPSSGELEQFGVSQIGSAVNVRYFTVSGVTNIIDGLIYSAPYGEDDGVFSELRADGLHELDTELVEFPYSFRGTDFDISFSYAVCDGTAHFRAHQKNLDENPYKYGWDIRSAGGEDKAWLLLPYDTPLDYGIYPLLLDLKSGEVSDVFADLPFDGATPFVWKFTDDMRYAVVTCYTAGFKTCFKLLDVGEKRLSDVSELLGREILECYPVGGSTLICFCAAGNGADVLRFDCGSGSVSVLLEGVGLHGRDGAGGRFVNIQYYGAPGRHALLVGEGGDITLIDLRSGDMLPLDGVRYDSSLLTYESPDGTRILFARRETGVINSSAMYELGVLDTHTGTLTTLQRENYLVRAENPCGWLRGGGLCVYAVDPEQPNGHCLYVYDFNS